MITCTKCTGKVFIDLTFTDNRNYEAFCIMCGKRWFVGRTNPLFNMFRDYVKSVLVT